MVDIVGKRNWFFLFSALITIPGLVFILLTPLTNGQAGLKFSIDYTGGTRWVIRFEDPNVDPDYFRYPGPKPQSRETAIAMLALVLAAKAEPALKPNQPTHSSAAPIMMKGTLCGAMAVWP